MPAVKVKFMYNAPKVFSFSDADLAAYHQFSQDNNPVHQSGVVFGVQLMAKVEGILVAFFDLGKTREFSYSFLNKVWVNAPIYLWISSDQSFEVWSSGQKVGEGMIKDA